MPLTPGYGETPLPHEELTALLPEVVDMFDEPTPGPMSTTSNRVFKTGRPVN